MNPYRSVAATIVVVVIGTATLYWGTDQWAAWTAESARRISVLNAESPLPDTALHTAGGDSIAFANPDRSLLLVDFIYTDCPTVCLAMGADFQHLQAEILAAGWQDQVQLLSVTFDPKDDNVRLRTYLKRFGAEPGVWQAARMPHDEARQEVLKRFGVVAIPEPTLGYVHNAAMYLLDGGRVIGIFDVGARRELLGTLRNLMSPRSEELVLDLSPRPFGT